MRIGLYGGSFNPVHLGHVGIAKRAIADLGLDKLIVIPANVSPFKTTGTDASRFWTWDRVEMVKAAFRDVEKTTVDLREIERGGVSYAIDTVREIHAELSAASNSNSNSASNSNSDSNSSLQLFFIIGEDSVEGLPRWKDIEELKKLVTFKAYPRTPESSTAIRELFENAGVVLSQDEKIVKAVRDGLVRKGGYCPCRLPKLPEFFCPCDEFKAQLADPGFHGLCHCRLYLKP